ncbi:DoxX family protein [Paenibacillus piri]|uniref:DoxX family protein n=1 Tax=Paenibacillus piri TaxID=2547395 RepID=A0A4R5KTL6_9BACL|nr:DoxX family protein [Paenibacillus piri]TDF98792.1 DoxX family protein [Paenibacillus piri]
MRWTVGIIQGLLAAAYIFFGGMKLTGNRVQAEVFTQNYHFPLAFMYAIGLVELLAAIGLIIGFKMHRVAFYSSGVIALIMAGAMFTHMSLGQGFGVWIIPLALLMMAVFVLIGRRVKKIW